MAQLPSIPNEIPQVRAPTPMVSPSDVAQPYQELAANLDKAGNVLMKDVAEPMATRAGLQAVTRDAQGNVQVDRYPIFGDAAVSYESAIKMAALADGEGVARRDDIALREKFRDNPQGYLAAAEAYKEAKQDQYAQAAGPAVGLALGKVIDSQTTQTFKGLQNEKERLDLQRADNSISAGISSARDDAMTLARGGANIDDPAVQQTLGKYEALLKAKVNNPRLTYTQDQANLDLEQFKSDLAGNRFIYNIDQVYKDKSVDANGQPNGGYGAALEKAKLILTDTSLKLSQQKREGYYHLAVGEIRSNESVRRQDLQELRSADLEYAQAVSFGTPADPSVVNDLIKKHYDLGDAPGALRLQGMWAKKPLMDGYGTQPLAEMNRQAAGFTTPASIRNNNPGAQWPGPVAAQFGSTGSQQLADGNKIATFPTPVHGAAAMFSLADSRYTGMKLGDAITKWSGGNNSTSYAASVAKETGLSPDTVITKELLRSHQGIALAKSMSKIEAGRPFPISDEQWGQAQNAAFGGAALGPGSQVPNVPNPADSLWLQQNRAKDLGEAGVGEWNRVVKDWKDSKYTFLPAPDKIKEIGDAAQLSGNGALSERMAYDLDMMQHVQSASQLGLPTQQAMITEYERRGAAGTLSQAGADTYRAMLARKTAIETGLKDDPVQTAVANLPNLNTPTPLNMRDPTQFAAGLAVRGKIAQIAASNWQSGPLSALGGDDLKQVQAAINTPDPAAKAAVFSAISTLPDDVRNATLGKLVEKGGPDTAISVAAGSMLKTAPEIAQSILSGQNALKSDKAFWPEGPDKQKASDELDKALPASAFSYESRVNPKGGYATAQGMVKARYADLSAKAADSSGVLNPDRLQQAANDVTGGIVTTSNGGKLIAPTRGMSQIDFDKTMQGVADSDLSGVTTPDGKPISAQYLRDAGTLETIGPGRYTVRFGSNTYAYQGAATESPQKFVLDLRNRPMGNWTPSYSSMMTGAQQP